MSVQGGKLADNRKDTPKKSLILRSVLWRTNGTSLRGRVLV